MAFPYKPNGTDFDIGRTDGTNRRILFWEKYRFLNNFKMKLRNAQIKTSCNFRFLDFYANALPGSSNESRQNSWIHKSQSISTQSQNICWVVETIRVL